MTKLHMGIGHSFVSLSLLAAFGAKLDRVDKHKASLSALVGPDIQQ